MLLEIKDELNNVDLSLSHVTKVVEEKTSSYPNFTTFIVIEMSGGGQVTLKGWTLEKWRNFRKSINQ